MARMGLGRSVETLAQVDQGLGPRGRVDDMVEASGERAIQMRWRQGGQQIFRQWFGEEVPIVDAALVTFHQVIEAGGAAGDHRTAQQHLAVVRLDPEASMADGAERGQDRFDTIVRMRQACQRQRPRRRGANALVRSLADSRVDNFRIASANGRVGPTPFRRFNAHPVQDEPNA